MNIPRKRIFHIPPWSLQSTFELLQIRNLGDGGDTCLDSAAKRDDFHKPIGLWPCHSQGGNQYWMFSKEGEIKRDEACLDYAGGDVILYPCHGTGGNQMWLYDPHLHAIQQASSKRCMELSADKQKIIMAQCNGSSRQKWLVQNYDETKLIYATS
ncbi:putative polypeptide N-acetylgalactosaminyltransferase 9 [Caerostris extrusa]|uniref:polypeptide N-acetylgalactosaminyltransferase n=1 Tax=Caerostris extrusa TaxID=172846 RepID=A0AAV4XL95_CAEEX|nr:putative polypeptide N-acetylgalactosaminyltransferase 9 [Caerostris extrusa]